MPDATITCPGCGDTHAAPHGDAEYLLHMVSRCDLCDARIVYGELAPRLVVEPSTFENGAPAMAILIQDFKTREVLHELKLDPQHAFLLAQSIISMVRP